MNLLIFDRYKYGKQLLIDTSTVQELVDVGDVVSITFYMVVLSHCGERYLTQSKAAQAFFSVTIPHHLRRL